MIEDVQLVWKALETYKASKADFADSLLGLRNLQAGCQFTATLDNAASDSPGYNHLLKKESKEVRDDERKITQIVGRFL